MTDEVKENLSWGRFFIRTFDACAIRTHIQILRFVGPRERRKHKIYREKEMRNFELDNQRQLDMMSWVNTVL